MFYGDGVGAFLDEAVVATCLVGDTVEDFFTALVHVVDTDNGVGEWVALFVGELSMGFGFEAEEAECSENEVGTHDDGVVGCGGDEDTDDGYRETEIEGVGSDGLESGFFVCLEGGEGLVLFGEFVPVEADGVKRDVFGDEGACFEEGEGCTEVEIVVEDVSGLPFEGFAWEGVVGFGYFDGVGAWGDEEAISPIKVSDGGCYFVTLFVFEDYVGGV